MKIILTLFLMLITFNGIGQTYTSSQSGDWVENSTWVGNVVPPNPIPNAGGTKTTTIVANHEVTLNDSLTINDNGHTLNVYGILILDRLIINNSTIINIFPNGNLTIKNELGVDGNAFEGDNKLTINIDEGGQFNVNGNMNIGNSAGIVIDGDMYVEGSITGGSGSITGNGSLITGGVIDPNIISSEFDGDVITNTCTNIRLDYEELNNVNGNIDVKLLWIYCKLGKDYKIERKINEEPVYVVITPTKNTTNYEFIDNNGGDGFKPLTVVHYKVTMLDGDNQPMSETKTEITTNPLPIELLFFNAKQHNNNIIIEWSTASETNNNYFVLERSNNTVLWETINITQSQGTTSQTTYYNYVDNNPFTNLNYYRLTQHDFDGKFETFNIIVVEYNNINNKPYNTIYYNMFGNIINNIETYSKAYIVVYFDGNNNIIKTEKRLNN